MTVRIRITVAIFIALGLPLCVQAGTDRPTTRSHATIFEAPGAGSGAYQGTIGNSINLWGTIVGYFADANGTNHGYTRAHDGSFTRIDHPLAANGVGLGTSLIGINDNGTLSGYYVDANDVYQGFIHRLDGSFETFGAPGADNGPFDGRMGSFVP